MSKIFLAILVLSLFAFGCASVSKCTSNEQPEKVYQASTGILKVQLSSDLRSNKIGLGSTWDQIKSVYGEPDDVLVSNCSVRAIYRPEKLKNITLWFDDGKLTSWSN